MRSKLYSEDSMGEELDSLRQWHREFWSKEDAKNFPRARLPEQEQRARVFDHGSTPTTLTDIYKNNILIRGRRGNGYARPIHRAGQID